MFDPLFGLNLRVEQHLAGFKSAVQFGDGPVLVSPAMMDLIRNAKDEEELRLVLSNIHIKKLPAHWEQSWRELPYTNSTF